MLIAAIIKNGVLYIDGGIETYRLGGTNYTVGTTVNSTIGVSESNSSKTFNPVLMYMHRLGNNNRSNELYLELVDEHNRIRLSEEQ